MESLRTLVIRDDSSDSQPSPLITKLLIALIVIVLFGLLCVGALLLLRSYRRKQLRKATLPLHNSPHGSPRLSHRRVNMTAAPYGRHSQVFVVDEKQALYDEYEPQSPRSPVPEIRITFPDEDDKAGKRQSGRVVVVRIGENGGVGLEPYEEESLPPYQTGDRFQSLDLERMGGLKEKELEKQWS